MERYSLAKARSEATKIQGKAGELISQREEKGNPKTEDYKKAEELLKNKKYGLESQKQLINVARKKAREVFSSIDVNKFRDGERYSFFPVVDQYFINQPIIDVALIKKMQSGGKMLSVGVGPAHLEELLYRAFDIQRDSILLADIQFVSEAQENSLNKIQFDMMEKWPELGNKFDYILFPESFGIANFRSIYEPGETARFYQDVEDVVNAVFKHATDSLPENQKNFVLKLFEHDIVGLDKKYFTINEAINNLSDEGEVRFSGHLMNQQELTYIALKTEEKYGRGVVEFIFKPYLKIIKHSENRDMPQLNQ